MTKRITLEGEKLNSFGGRCKMPEGAAIRARMGFPHEFTDFIATMGECEAITLGRMNQNLPDCCKIINKDRLAAMNGTAGPDLIARSGKYFCYEPGELALLLIDVDTKTVSPAARQRMAELGGPEEALEAVMPVLRQAARVVRQSTSSGIFSTETGECFQDSGGLHVYVLLHNENADTSKLFLTRMHQRAWLAGVGWGSLDSIGKFHQKSLVDPIVAQAERLVFEANPELGDGLEQDLTRRKPTAVEGRTLTLDDCPDLTEAESARLAELVAAEDLRLRPEGRAIQQDYVKGLTRELRVRKPDMTAAEALRAALSELRRKLAGKLSHDSVLVFDGLGAVTVTDVLACPERYVRKACADPVEGPGYGRQTAMLMRNPKDGHLWVKSHAHSGQTFDLPGEHARGSASEHAPPAQQAESAEAPQATQAEPDPEWSKPLDFLADEDLTPPVLLERHVPAALWPFVVDTAERMGVDPACVALSCIVACASVLTDDWKVQPKRLDYTWTENPRLWGAIVGDPSILKTPVINAAIRPIQLLEVAARAVHAESMVEHRKLEKAYKADKSGAVPAPVHPRLDRYMVEGTTVDAFTEVLRDDPEAKQRAPARKVLSHHDEMSEFFGSMDRYTPGSKTGSADRGAYLRLYNGGWNSLDRVGRGVFAMPNWSACFLGGIQPGPIQRVAKDATDDGLLQRFMYAVPGPQGRGLDRAPDEAAQHRYKDLFSAMVDLRPPSGRLRSSAPSGNDHPQTVCLHMAAHRHREAVDATARAYDADA